MSPKDIHILTPRHYGYAELYDKGERAQVIEELRLLSS